MDLLKSEKFLNERGKLNEINITSLIFSMWISLLLWLVPTLLLYSVDKAKQLVFYEMASQPFISTFFVFAFSMLNLYIFVQRSRGHSTEPNLFKKTGVLTQIFAFLILLLPQAIWTWVVFSNKAKIHEGIFFTLLLSSIFCVVLFQNSINLLYDKKLKNDAFDNRVDNFFKEWVYQKLKINNFFQKRGDISTPEQYKSFIYYRLKMFGFWVLLIATVYNIMIYEFYDFRDSPFNCKDFIEKHPFLFNVLVVLSCLWMFLAFRYWFFVNIFMKPTEGNRTLKKVLLNTCFFFVSASAFIVLMQLGSNRTFDVLILYFLTLRYLSFNLSLSFRRILSNGFKNSFENFWEKIKNRNYLALRQPVAVIISACIIVGIASFTIDFFTGSKSEERKLYAFEPKAISEEPKTSERYSTDDYVKHWLMQDSLYYQSTEPIIIMLGQGGGSRAGASMYNALARLDSHAISRNNQNLLAIITISGSSNGAGFYLGAKHGKYSGSKNIQSQTEALYNVDYITNSMYKMLFTDHFFSVAQRIRKWNFLKSRTNRNDFLMALEKNTLAGLLGIKDKKLASTLLDKGWSEVYSPSLETNTETILPLFMPVTYNVTQGRKAISAPYELKLENEDYRTVFSINDSTNKFKIKSELTIGQSVALSEMFPIISASANISSADSTSYDSYMDGGVYDNVAFEVGHNFYKRVAELRDSLSPERPIYILSVENGKIEGEKGLQYSELSSTLSSVLNSVFVSNVITHLKNFEDEVKFHKEDQFKRLCSYVFKNEKKSDSLDVVGEVSDTSAVVMSRFLTKSEIYKINNNLKGQFKEKLNFEKPSSLYVIPFDLNEAKVDRRINEILRQMKGKVFNAKKIRLTAFCDKLNRNNIDTLNRYIAQKRVKVVEEKLTSFLKNKLPAGKAIPQIEITPFNEALHVGKGETITERNKDRKVEIVLFN